MSSHFRSWLAACGLSVVPAVGLAQMPPAVLPPVETVSLPPVERVPTPAPAKAWPTPAVIATDLPAELPRVAAAPGIIPDATPPAACPTPAAGHRDLHDKCTYTKFGNVRAKKIPPALAVAHGVVVRGAFDRQRDLALAEYFVVHREDFHEHTADLNATGLRHVAGIQRRIAMIDAPIKVEPTGVAALDEKRRLAVIEALIHDGADGGVSARVQGGTTRAEGLRYEDVSAVGRQNPLLGGNGFGGGGMGLNGSGGGGGGPGGATGGGFGGFR